jgi:hypothetical protein
MNSLSFWSLLVILRQGKDQLRAESRSPTIGRMRIVEFDEAINKAAVTLNFRGIRIGKLKV